MDWLVDDIEQNGPATTEEEAQQRPVPDFEGQAASTQVTAAVSTAALRLLGLAPERPDGTAAESDR